MELIDLPDSQPDQERPIVFELLGESPPEGHQFCAVCCMLYLGAVSADPVIQRAARAQADRAIEAGAKAVVFKMPAREDKLLRIAVTVAPSVYFQVPMPVCWIHVQGYNPDQPQGKRHSNGSRLIPGKAYRAKG